MTHTSGAQTSEQSNKPRFLISDLCAYLESYLSVEHVREVYRSYVFSAEAHEGQKRLSGEPYIYHPLAVARILADIRLDHRCIMAAIMHDVLEDTTVTKAQLAEEFGEEVAALVDGVSKLNQINFPSKAEAQAASFRKMLLAMTQDIRIILIKLADRLHNMRTLEVMRPEKCRRIARETLEIYAPIAHRLGIYRLRTELEELCFAAYWPMRYRALKEAVSTARGNRKEVMSNIDAALVGRLEQEGIVGVVRGREKHLYSIYTKMRDKKRSFSEVVDVYAFRIIVDRLDTCYRVLGVVHNLYKPVPGRFKDYIAIPKANGYQSLHTLLFGPHGLPIEIQIRTVEMDRMADSGIAAHWLYKSSENQSGMAQADASSWLKNLLELQKDAGDSMEFLEHVKVDLFPDEVYVFTPRGKIMVLAKGATVIDFAYAVHSDVGNHTVAARVDRHMVPLRTRLYSGQTVEVITSETANPSAAWLNFVVTGKARANIRGYLKNLRHQEAITLGRRLLNKELAQHELNIDQIPLESLAQLLKDFHLTTKDALLEEIGLGNRMPFLVSRRLVDSAIDLPKGEAVVPSADSAPLAITGTEGMVVRFAKCCRPLPGDEIVAIFNPGKGIVVHRHECRNLGDFRKSDSWLDVKWEAEPAGDFTTEIKVDVGNKRGALASVASAISEMGSNIKNVVMEERDGLTSTLHFIVAVDSRKHLANIMRRLRLLNTVLRIYRVG
ncbi:bifunctional GTP diphosphokinase/guanosine-3',5'-bis pyrophosphate 3'-pyrophosphohydrolase [Sedimenticola selenatireducens]|uniref:guanosine-3',5'-bis(diphosphate) 3'-diphosphatase n=1 Tax=Sedimenticola selenatireducens TaxID=191960 RepID=A0A557S3D8_9GAMM|nr:bifunctional GTP diphosphokinase/guanosine-3',5'-bis pyrophosphate 3'-pyrophosphohydrolase [Sedimenticola selenatireducens]TVO71926.1 bifunctional GTP diphosphokinase/guanosine-3',5'-bis pyrophosphate 3'-pyrophosphohydrolase [Sedimenticola selenatireducens]TVT66306.1 MAG: bifunctional GTP diphosphokinase/guanosine-3',5'-bis pyrophosphate 3'-pyrophosphohydrolase [Sedimenticola selenatireducens]